MTIKTRETNLAIRRIVKDLSKLVDDMAERISRPGYTQEEFYWDSAYIESCLNSLDAYIKHGK